jgi:hypothetical protein
VVASPMRSSRDTDWEQYSSRLVHRRRDALCPCGSAGAMVGAVGCHSRRRVIRRLVDAHTARYAGPDQDGSHAEGVSHLT